MMAANRTLYGDHYRTEDSVRKTMGQLRALSKEVAALVEHEISLSAKRVMRTTKRNWYNTLQKDSGRSRRGFKVKTGWLTASGDRETILHNTTSYAIAIRTSKRQRKRSADLDKHFPLSKAGKTHHAATGKKFKGRWPLHRFLIRPAIYHQQPKLLRKIDRKIRRTLT